VHSVTGNNGLSTEGMKADETRRAVAASVVVQSAEVSEAVEASGLGGEGESGLASYE